MMKRRKKFALLMAGATAVASCAFSCQQKSNSCSTKDIEDATTTAVIADVTECNETATEITTTTTAKITSKVTTATTTLEQIVATTTKVSSAYIAEASAIATTTEAIPEAIMMPVETTTQQVQVQVNVETQPAIPIGEIGAESTAVEPEQLEVYEQSSVEVSARYLSNYAAPATYIIQDGDCLWTIAEENGVDAAEIQSTNPEVVWEMIQPGDMIYLPVDTFSEGYYVVVSGDCLSIVAEKMGYTEFEIATSNQQIDWENLQIGEVVYAPMYVSYEETAEVAPITEPEPEYSADTVVVEEPIISETVVTEVIAVEEIVQETETTVADTITETDSDSDEEIVSEDESNVVEETDDKIAPQNEADVTDEEKEPQEDAFVDEDGASNTGVASENNDEVAEEQGRIAYFYATTGATGASLRNIKRSCEELDGMIIPAYGTFSWFTYVGSCEDYEPATIMQDGFVPTADNPAPLGNGGGICFTSTCLRNAAEKLVGAENIIEAHDHIENGVPKDMSYAPVGKQASLNYPYWDLQFANPYAEDIQIICKFSEATSTCYVAVSTGIDW